MSKFILALIVSITLCACASESEHNFYSYYGGQQTITGNPTCIKPLGWAGARRIENGCDYKH